MPGYSPGAVARAIQASNRSGRLIGAREAKAIHRLLQGHLAQVPKPEPKPESK
jgi:hypothetical protein